MKDTVLNSAFRVLMLKLRYTESDMREAYLRGYHARV